MVMFDDPRDPERLPRTPRERMPMPTAPSPMMPTPLPNVPPEPVRTRTRPSDSGATLLPSDIVGDIPPPPIPQPPIIGPGVAGIPGTTAGTFARPGSAAATPFRTPAYTASRQQRFGPGAPIVGGAGLSGFEGDAGSGLGAPDDVAELLRALAAGRGGA